MVPRARQARAQAQVQRRALTYHSHLFVRPATAFGLYPWIRRFVFCLGYIWTSFDFVLYVYAVAKLRDPPNCVIIA